MQNIEQINFKMVNPCDELNSYVQTIWFAENPENIGEVIFKVLNDCATGISLNFGDELTYQRNKNSVKINNGCITNGSSTDLLRIIFNGRISAIGIHFYPITGHFFFNCSMNKLSEKILKTSNDHFHNIDNLYEELNKSLLTNVAREKIVKIIETYLVDRLRESSVDASIQSTLAKVSSIIINNHEITVKELAEQVSLSYRGIQRLFKKYVGVSPKSLIRLHRVTAIKNKIAEGNFDSLADLSINSGYFDQAHFVKDFKMLMEETPKNYYGFKNKKQ